MAGPRGGDGELGDVAVLGGDVPGGRAAAGDVLEGGVAEVVGGTAAGDVPGVGVVADGEAAAVVGGDGTVGATGDADGAGPATTSANSMASDDGIDGRSRVSP